MSWVCNHLLWHSNTRAGGATRRGRSGRYAGQPNRMASRKRRRDVQNSEGRPWEIEMATWLLIGWQDGEAEPTQSTFGRSATIKPLDRNKIKHEAEPQQQQLLAESTRDPTRTDQSQARAPGREDVSGAPHKGLSSFFESVSRVAECTELLIFWLEGTCRSHS